MSGMDYASDEAAAARLAVKPVAKGER